MPSPELRSSPQTSQSLLLRLCDVNDHESWQLFFAIYRPVLRDYFQRRGLQAADSDDLVQEVLTSVVKAMREARYDRSRAVLGPGWARWRRIDCPTFFVAVLTM